jgi:exosortase
MGLFTATRPACQTGPSELARRGFSREIAAQSVWGVLALLTFAPTIFWLWQRWTMDVWHNIHGLFIPFVVAYFTRKVIRSDQVADAEQSAWGFLFIGFGLGMIVLDSAIRTQLLSALGLVICLPGFSLLLLGPRRTKALTFAWMLCFFMLPIPAAFVETLMLLLRRMTAWGSEHLVALCGVPVIRVDTTLFLPVGPLIIGDGCSGFSVLYASVALALFLAYINCSRVRGIVTIALAVPIAVACNSLRCTILALLVARWGGGILNTRLHPLSGMLTFAAAMALLTFLSRMGIREQA